MHKPIFTRTLLIIGGSLVHTIRVTDISVRIDAVFLPFSSALTDWRFSGSIPGKSSTGQVNWAGKTSFLTDDTAGKLTLRNLDMLVLKPYMPPEGAMITGGSPWDCRKSGRAGMLLKRVDGRSKSWRRAWVVF